MNRLVAFALCLAGCSAAAANPVAACRQSMVPLKNQTPVKDFSSPLPIPDYLDAVIGCNTPPAWQGLPQPPPPPKSAWLESERLLYQAVLAKRPVDILIVPFQVQGYGLDRIERSLMTAELAYALGDASDYRIADPFLVARALGEGARRIDPSDVERLARKLGATRIITGYVGHDLHHAFTLTLQVRELPAPGPTPVYRAPWQRDWRGVAFTNEQMPAFVFNEMLPDVLRALPLQLTSRQASARQPTPGATLRVTQAPLEMATAHEDPGSTVSAAEFDLLGALGTLYSERSRERAFERALLVSLRGGQTGPTDRFLRAYALTQLWRRPAALATLAGQTSAESMALVAILNGDLPAAQKAVARVPQSLQRLLLDVGLRDLESVYGRKLQAKAAASPQTFGTAGSHWEPLVQWRVLDPDVWSAADPLVVKALLDETFPIPGFDVTSIVRGSAVTRGESVDEVEVDLANVRHVRRAATQLDPEECCRAGSLRPTRWDLLWLLEGLSEGRISKSLSRQTELQALPESAMQAIGRYEPLLGGLPALELMRSEAAFGLYQKSSDDTRGSWLTQIEQSAMIAALHDPGQNAIAWRALVQLGVPSPRSQYMVDAYGYDYPRRPFWHMWFFGMESDQQRMSMALEALAFSVNSVEPLQWLPPGNEPGHAGAVIASLGSRFTGNPRRPTPELPVVDEPRNQITHLEDAIRKDPDVWVNYAALGEYLVTSGGSYQAARDAFLRYPGFRDRHPDNPVALSNYAYEAGSLLYWQGLPALAKPLYKIAADLDTGSEASMSSQARLQMMAGDYSGAAGILLERANRYSSAQAYRDYLSYLYAFGKPEEAWQGFSQINASFALPAVWAAALVGQEIQGQSDGAVRDWLMRPEIRDAHFRTMRFASYYATLWHATEHTPPADLGKFVEQLEGSPVGKIDSDGHALLVPSMHTEGNFQIVWPSALRRGKTPALPPDTPIKSEYAYFADAYAAVRLGDYDAAVARFVAMADHYPIEGYPLGYFAYAAARTGDKEKLEQYLEPRKANPDFDTWLARAFFAVGRKDADTALGALQHALRSRPNTDFRPVLTEYQYAQACEWLFRDTHDDRFAAALLDWTKKFQTVQPTQAWAYAMEYAYGKPGPERTRALALTLYLDPASGRIQSASKQELAAARAWLREHNPFRIPAAAQHAPNVTTMSHPAHPVRGSFTAGEGPTGEDDARYLAQSISSRSIGTFSIR